METLIRRGLLALTLTGSVACATTEPTARMASAQAAIQSASQTGVASTPTAALHLQYAREEYSQAQGMTHDGRNDRATLLLQRSQVDAELAMVLAHEDGARAEAQQAIDRVRAAEQPAVAQ